jgi:hypothetical protein
MVAALLLAWPWLPADAQRERLHERFAPPPGYERETLPAGSFGAWLRDLPLLPAGSRVLLFDGRPKWRQDVHAAVVDLDVGRRNLQQCADAVMRLRAEYLFAGERSAEIAFNATSGDRLPFARWARGERPIPDTGGRRLRWAPGGRADASHAALRRYLDVVFGYAGSWSLARELRAVPVAELQPGDVFIQGGFPGHAVIVLESARAPDGGRVFLLAQSYMPAQQVHVLRRPGGDGAWYPLEPEASLATPEWTFPPASLRRF